MRERRLMHRSVLVGVVVAAGCGGSNVAAPPGTSGVATTAVPAGDLAPSQLTASTVARPATPPACDPARLAFESVGSIDPATVAVITITNQGDAWCEVNVFESPSVDPLMEPDVWLETGQRAELVVEAASNCPATSSLASIPLVVNGEQIDVSIPTTDACSPVLTAFYPA